ncbi:MAG: dihydroorotase [Clostridiales bacterium]|nr:dihydroorotase [Clostridiales bacterium]
MAFVDKKFTKCDISIEDNVIKNISTIIPPMEDDFVIDLKSNYLLPGLIDVHVHLREPGFIYKETVETGSMAGAKGGYTSICAMPNLNPVPDSMENLKIELEAIEKTANINVYPYGAITKEEKGEELSDMEEMSKYIIAFSDDGKGIQEENMMLEAMNKAKELNKIIAAHCEVNALLNNGYIHDGEYAKIHGHRGICSESEWKEIERDIELAKKTGVKYHVCHISTKESVELIRKAKKAHVDITCETGPHYLILDDMMLQEDGRFKMNPPIRSKEDRQALIEGILDGTIDMIATDHAPHSEEEKSKGLEKSVMGIVGLETAFPLLYTYFVKEGIISLEKLVELMNTNPRERFEIGTEIKVGEKADLTVYDLNEKYIIDSNNFASKGKSTPFNGYEVFGKCKMTMVGGKIIFNEI